MTIASFGSYGPGVTGQMDAEDQEVTSDGRGAVGDPGGPAPLVGVEMPEGQRKLGPDSEGSDFVEVCLIADIGMRNEDSRWRGYRPVRLDVQTW